MVSSYQIAAAARTNGTHTRIDEWTVKRGRVSISPNTQHTRLSLANSGLASRKTGLVFPASKSLDMKQAAHGCI